MGESLFTVSDNVWTADLGDGDTALFNNSTQRYLTMNETARAIWENLREAATPVTVATALVEEFDVTLDDAQKAVEEFLDLLLAEGLIQKA